MYVYSLVGVSSLLLIIMTIIVQRCMLVSKILVVVSVHHYTCYTGVRSEITVAGQAEISLPDYERRPQAYIDKSGVSGKAKGMGRRETTHYYSDLTSWQIVRYIRRAPRGI